ncbi:MAG: hypothetical protein MJH11_13425 [Lentisphaeria bacterium]|nr:hypothetical protein [Lentisphaeria bacterium]
MKTSGSGEFTFALRDDLYSLPDAVKENEVKLHGGFAIDNRPDKGQLYYGMPGSGILRVESDLKSQELITLPDNLGEYNFHSTKIASLNGQERLILSAEGNQKVLLVDLEGSVDMILTRPEFDEYKSEDVNYLPTDTVLVDDVLYIADGYGANYISSNSLVDQSWKGIFGGIAADANDDGKFSTAHGINYNPVHKHLDICDRPNSRIQAHDVDGGFLGSYKMPSGSFLCGINYFESQERWYAVIGCLQDPEVGEGRPAPVIEKLPGYDNVILASAHYRNGVLLAPATAEMVKEMVLSG